VHDPVDADTHRYYREPRDGVHLVATGQDEEEHALFPGRFGDNPGDGA